MPSSIAPATSGGVRWTHVAIDEAQDLCVAEAISRKRACESISSGKRKTKEPREPRTIFSAVTPLIPADIELPATLSTIPEHVSAEGSSHPGSMASRERLTRCCPPSSVSRTSTRWCGFMPA